MGGLADLGARGRVDLGRAWGMAAGARLLAGFKARTRGAVVFAYHDVGDEPNSTGYSVSPGLLRDHLAWARHWSLRCVDLARICEPVVEPGAAGEPAGGFDGRVGVCFDDALVGVHRHGLDVLREAGVSATVFVVAGALGCDPWWWPGASPVMSASELLEVVAAGHRIGSHTLTHPSLPSLDDATLERELHDSRASLEDLVQQPVEMLAYPSGHHDGRVRAHTAAAGYRGAFTFLNGRITSGLDRFMLPRLTMSHRQDRPRLAYQIARPAWSWPDPQGDVVPGRL